MELNIIVITVLLMEISMREKKDILVKINCSEKEEDLGELENRKIRIVFEVLKEKYGDVILEEYISSIRGNLGKKSK